MERRSPLQARARVLVATIVLLGPAAASAQSFRALGDLSGGSFNSFAYGISADGRVVVGQSAVAGGPEAFYWTELGGMVAMGELPGGFFGSSARAASGDGSVIVGLSDSAAGTEAFRWHAPSTMIGMGDLAGGTFASVAHGISDAGTRIVGEGVSASGSEAWVWQGAALIPLGDLPGGIFGSRARGISGDGDVIVGSSHSGVWEPFVFETGFSMVGLGNLPGIPDLGVAKAANLNGKRVVGWDEHSVVGEAEAFRWAGGSIIGMGYLAGATRFHSNANDTTDDGSIIVGASGLAVGGLTRAFIWDAGNGMRDLQILLVALGVDLQGFQLMAATGISSDGTRLTGFGLNAMGDVEAWFAVLPNPTIPTPPIPALPAWGALLLTALLPAALALRARRAARSR